MTLQDLSKRLEALLNAIVALSNTYGLPEIIDRCIVGLSEIEKPLKIALTGITSAGKSTLLNAFVKRNIAPTGAAALTYNVNAFRHVSLSPTGGEILIAHLLGGEMLQLPIDALSELVDGRLQDGTDLRDKILWVEAYIESDILKSIDLIDTPGLGSTKEKDSANTVALFKDELRRPDVVVYMVQGKVQEEDIKAAKLFQASISKDSGAKITGLNTVLALTHCDNLRQEDEMDDLDYSIDFHLKGRDLIRDNYDKFADFRACFSKSFTLAALYAQSGYALTSTDFSVLKELHCRFGSRIFFGEFSKKQIIDDGDLFGFISQEKNNRAKFVERVDIEIIKYGVWWIGLHPDAEYEEFRHHLIDLSGIEQMESYVLVTFKRLAIFFKTVKIHSGVMSEVNVLSNRYQPSRRRMGLREISILSRDFEVELRRAFSFLSVKMDFYQGKTYFKAEEWENALKTIDMCLSNDRLSDFSKSMKSYWEERLKYYRLLCDNEAIESCLQILEQIKICV